MTASQKEVFPQDIDTFISEYRRIKPTSAVQYNLQRVSGAKGWCYIAKGCGTTRWRGLLDILDLPVYDIHADSPAPRFKVNIFTHYDFRD